VLDSISGIFRKVYQHYINLKGQECSEIDCFLYNRNTDRKFSDKIIQDKLEPNTSDHYPISITCNANLEYRNTSTKTKNKIKINWDPSSYHLELAFFISLYVSDMFLFQICSLPSFFFLFFPGIHSRAVFVGLLKLWLVFPLHHV
jgi:hypothetical protein